jgi:nitrile hydratase
MKPAFRIDQRVRVLPKPREGDDRGHVRTPAYLRGRTGRVLGVEGSFPDPAALARGDLGLPYRMLYRVAFHARALWPEGGNAARDEVVADIYEHWLAAAEGTDAT